MYTDQDNVPFYIGKGCGDRWRPSKHVNGHTAIKINSIGVDNVKVYFFHENLTEEEALRQEKYWIKHFGRQDNDTGILTNQKYGRKVKHKQYPKYKRIKLFEEIAKEMHEQCLDVIESLIDMELYSDEGFHDSEEK